jgi:hypothetical protein
MATSPNTDRLQRRVMFAMDFRDPVTRLPVTGDLNVAAEGLGAPVRALSGLFVWFDMDPPARRDIKVTAVSASGRFADYEEVITAPEHVPNIPASSLCMPRALRPTGLYEPPEGMTGVAGWLVEDEGLAPVADAEVSIAFRHAGNQDFVSSYKAVTDAGGGFVAVANDLGDVAPDPAPPKSDADVLGWLVVTRSAPPSCFTGFLPLRAGRLARIAAPLRWKDLQTMSPP